MIVADRKSLQEILAMVENNKKILIIGCKGCVTVCNVGGLKEVEICYLLSDFFRANEPRMEL